MKNLILLCFAFEEIHAVATTAREKASQSLPPARGCVEPWRKGEHPGTLRRPRTTWGLCDLAGDWEGPCSSRPLRAGLSRFCRLCGGRKKKLDKEVTSSPPIFTRHNCPHCGQFQGVPGFPKVASKSEGKGNCDVTFP